MGSESGPRNGGRVEVFGAECAAFEARLPCVMSSNSRLNTRAAVLAAAMNIIPAAPVDIFRFLNVPAIVLTLKQVKGRLCLDVHKRHVTRSKRVRPKR